MNISFDQFLSQIKQVDPHYEYIEDYSTWIKAKRKYDNTKILLKCCNISTSIIDLQNSIKQNNQTTLAELKTAYETFNSRRHTRLH